MTAPVPHVPGAFNLTTLTGKEIIAVAGVGPASQQVNIAQIANFGQTLGTFVANGVTPVVVAAPKVTANSTILITLKTPGGTVGALPAIQTITPGTGFTVEGTALDTSTYNYLVIN